MYIQRNERQVVSMDHIEFTLTKDPFITSDVELINGYQLIVELNTIPPMKQNMNLLVALFLIFEPNNQKISIVQFLPPNALSTAPPYRILVDGTLWLFGAVSELVLTDAKVTVYYAAE